MKRGENRWGDDSYLARIIFSEMIQHEVLKETGYGISPYGPDGDDTFLVDLENQTVNGQSFEEFIEKDVK